MIARLRKTDGMGTRRVTANEQLSSQARTGQIHTIGRPCSSLVCRTNLDVLALIGGSGRYTVRKVRGRWKIESKKDWFL